MKYSQLFTKTRKQAPKDELTKNAQLLVKAGFVNKLMAGVYSYLPMGLRVLRKIENIVREEMNAIGGQEVLLPALHPSKNWKQTGGWDSIDVLFKIKSRTKKDYHRSRRVIFHHTDPGNFHGRHLPPGNHARSCRLGNTSRRVSPLPGDTGIFC